MTWWWWLFFSSCPVRANFFSGGDPKSRSDWEVDRHYKRGGKQQKAYPCGDQEKDPEDDGCGPELELTNKLCKKGSAVLNVWVLAF